ncbi:MAG TPA: hypothetical protein VKG38_16355, partial [Solirubrobacteraceae bacterium]|nr:hypothetical protein [Solirubrobacteraceae bacterium]
RVRTLTNAFFGVLILTLGICGLTLSKGQAPLVVVLVGIVAMWVAAMVVALAVCRAAAAGDRAAVDGERLEARRAGPVLLVVSPTGQGQPRRQQITPTREPARPCASTTRCATARPPARY